MSEHTLDLSTLGLPSIELEEDQFVTDAILVVRSSLPNGVSRCSTIVTHGMDFIVGRGMIMTAKDAVFEGALFVPVEEDE